MLLSITEPTHQYLIFLNILEEISQFPWDDLIVELDRRFNSHTQKLHINVFTGCSGIGDENVVTV